jgi:hypothetical protein
MLIMSFSQNGIDRLQDYMDTVEVGGEPPSVSTGFDDGTSSFHFTLKVLTHIPVAVDWFGGRYEICSQRAQLVKVWLPENAIHDQPTFMDQVVFERALSLVSITLVRSLNRF